MEVPEGLVKEIQDAAVPVYLDDLERFFRERLEDESRPWEDRIGQLAEEMVGVRRLAREEGWTGEERHIVKRGWEAARDIVWTWVGDRITPMPGMLVEYCSLGCAVFGDEPALYGPMLKVVREHFSPGAADWLIEMADLKEDE